MLSLPYFILYSKIETVCLIYTLKVPTCLRSFLFFCQTGKEFLSKLAILINI